MTKSTIGGLTALLAAAAISAAPATMHAQDVTKINGVIVARSGAEMIVHPQGATGNTTVTLSSSTKVEVKGGPLGIKKSSMGPATLIPGLRVEVQGTPESNGGVAATKVEFSSGDLKTANEIQAGVDPTAALADTNAEGVAENKAETDSLSKRFGELGDYDVIAQDTVFFGVNSAVIYPTGQQTLKALAAKAKGMPSYNVLVAGYTDASGNAEYNQQLSERRAQAVIEYLEQKTDLPLYLVLAPAAMGFSHPAASNETAEGAAKNRRVVASIVVNRGVTGQ
jgi:OOP family OmpA-OmpF porin